MPKRTDLKNILLIGSGAIVIGQACEFDYSGTQACKALREEGYRVVLVNSNPATIMTDPDTADRTYIEPITWQVVEQIIERERPDALLPTLGGQTGLNTAMALHENGVLAKYGVEMIGADAEVIARAEDREQFKQAMIRAIGVETGGSNIQFAVNPADGRMIAIEMNPRVSRSSALASKATGFPIAKIAAKLAVGYTLDELQNDITKTTPASFEPTIDYVVTKVPRFNFEKFPEANPTLTTQMKSVGETMAIGRTFKESLQKALRGLETGRFGLGLDRGDRWGTPDQPGIDEIIAKLATPNAERVWFIRYALKAGMTVEDVYRATKIDPWFLHHVRELVEFEDELTACPDLESASAELLLAAKQMGFSDRQLAHVWHSTELEVRRVRKARGVEAVFKSVDTCAAEFEAVT